MARALYNLGRFCARWSLVVIGAWIVVAVMVGLTVRAIGADTNNDLSLPGTGSQEVKDLLSERFPPQQNGTNPIVFAVDKGKLTDSTYKSSVTSAVKALRKAPHVYSVTNPVSSDGQTAGLLSDDKRTAFAPLLLDIPSGDVDEDVAEEIFAAADPARDAGITVAAAGSLGSELSAEPTEISEVVGIVAAMVILSLVLGSLIAMGLPIITAIIGLGIGLALVGLTGHVLSVPTTGPTLATMIALGVGIDYALFLVTRHQDTLREGVAVHESIADAVATSGSAIVFAGGTVVIALLSLRVAGIPLLSTLGLVSAIAVVIAVLAAISLLPAFLGLLGHRIEKVALPGFLRPSPTPQGGMWARWSGWVARHPIWVTAVALAVLPLLILPVLSLELGQEDVGAASPDTTERQAYDLLASGMGVGYDGPLQVASRLDPVAAPSTEFTNKYNKAQSLQKDLKQKQKQLPQQQQDLEAQQKQLQAEQRSLENQQASLERQAADLQAQEAQLESEARQLRSEQSQLEAQQATLEEESGQLRAEQAQLERESTQLRAQQARLEKEEARLLREQKALEKQKARLQREQTALERERAALRKQAEALARQIRPLAGQLARLLARERVLERRIERLDDRPRRQARLEARLQQLQQEEKQVRAALAPLRREAKLLAQEARKLARQAAELDRQAQQLQAEGAQLQKSADQLQRQADRLTAQGAELKEQAARLTAQGAELQRQAESLRAHGAELQEEADSLPAQAAALQRQADSLQQQGAELQQEGDRLKQQGDQLQQQADQLKSEQQQAKQEQKQAEQLQDELTDQMTAAGGDERGTDQRVVALQKALSGTDGVVTLTPPQINKKGDVVLLSAIPSTAPASNDTADLVGTVRSDVLPGVEDDGGISSYVGGYTASYVDLASLISARLLLVIAVVILLGFLLLMVAFRSLLIPLQAAITNLLSAAAAFGVLTATFQWGWGVSLVGLDASGSVPIASYVPLMMFAVLFGLSMDYEVFLVSHVQRHHAGGESARQAVASGLRTSARITTAAALIMSSVFASFILNGDPTIKQFGVGLSVAVLLAGVLVVTLAPAVLMLFGEAAWWLPRWLDRLLPHISIEGESNEPPAPPAGAHAAGRPAGGDDSDGGLALIRDAPRP